MYGNTYVCVCAGKKNSWCLWQKNRCEGKILIWNMWCYSCLMALGLGESGDAWTLAFKHTRTHSFTLPLPSSTHTHTHTNPTWDFNQRAALLVLTRPGVYLADVCVSNQGWEEVVTERMYQLSGLIGLYSTVAKTISPTTDCNLTAPDVIH